jgi:hypothetical protein
MGLVAVLPLLSSWSTAVRPRRRESANEAVMNTVKAVVFHGVNDIRVEEARADSASTV